MGSQIVGHDWATELNWTELNRQAVDPPISQLLTFASHKCGIIVNSQYRQVQPTYGIQPVDNSSEPVDDDSQDSLWERW